MAIILFADNDPDFLSTRCEYLEKEGYTVIRASNPTQAMRQLERGGIDLAVLDIRLKDDSDRNDTSGLALAKKVALSTPKIILTGFPDFQTVLETLSPQLEGLPPAFAYIQKKDGPQAMLQAIRKTLEFSNDRLRKTTDDIAKRLMEDYLDSRRQSQMNYWASIVAAVLGITIIFVGIALSLGGILAVGIVSSVGGIITEAVSYLFFKRVDIANGRMDRYHAESLQTRQFENLLASCDSISNLDKRENSKENIIKAAAEYWFGASSTGQSPRD